MPSSSAQARARASRAASACVTAGQPDGVELGEAGQAEIGADVRAQQPDRRHQPGMGRDDDAAHAHRLGDLCGVQRAAAAEGEQGEVTRILAPLDRDHPDGAGDAHGRNLEDSGGGLKCIEAERFADLALDGSRGGLCIDRHASVQQRDRVEAPQHDVGVGEGRPGAAAPVAGRTRLGAGALRPHFRQPAGVDPSQAAAAGADRVEVEAGRADRQAAHVALRGAGRAEAAHEAHIRAGAADVDGDEIGDAA